MRKLAFLYLYLSLACLVLLRCSLDPFEMPSWDVQLNLPVLTEDYTFEDLADDEEAIKVLNDSMYIQITEALAGLDLAGRFDFNPYVGEFGTAIGTFRVAAIDPAATCFTIAEVWSEAASFSGHLEVPPFCFPGVGGPIPSRAVSLGDEFAWAEVEAGVVEMTVENGLEVPLGDPSRGCPFVLRVSWYGGVWDSVVFDEPIPAGGSRQAEVDLAGLTIANTIMVSMSGGSPGSDGGVDFSPIDEIGINVAPGPVTISRALATLPAQRFEGERSITVEDSTRVVLAGIQSGTLCLSVFNNLAVGVSVEVSTANLTSGGEPLSYSATIPALSLDGAEIDVSGYTLDTGSVPGDPWYGTNTVTFEVAAETRCTSHHVEVDSSDSLRVAVEMRDVVFDRVTGTLKPTPVEISEVHEVDLPEICRAISISGATLVLSLRNEAMVGGDFEVEVTGESGEGSETAVLMGEIIPAGLSGSPSEVEYEYDGEDVRDLISIVPDLITVEGRATVWGQGRVYSTDALVGDLTMTIPMVFEIEADTLEFEPRNLDIPEEVRDEIEDAAQDAVFHGRLITDLDINGAFNVYFGADSAGAYSEPLFTMAKAGGYSRFGAGAQENEFEVHLSREALQVFLRETVWVGLEILLDSTAGPVTARPDDYFRLEGHVRLVRRVE
ncbi:MAG: hypothetical protein PVF95_11125 [bacterium]